MATQIASALAVAHGAGIVHRDIKPENIMLRPDGYVKVLDFGIAKFTEQQAFAAAQLTDLQLTTQPGIILGTTRYMSPEQARGQPVDARSDIWSLGAVLYEMLAHRPPFEGGHGNGCHGGCFDSTTSTTCTARSGLSRQTRADLSKALQKEKGERYTTAGELLLELRDLKAELEVQEKIGTSRTSRLLYDSITKKPRRRFALAIALIGTLAIALVVIQGMRPKTDRAATAAPIAANNSKSIAVLPFENLSSDQENAFFADGVHEQILTQLATSRT
jgi:serine/threonine protein kinase